MLVYLGICAVLAFLAATVAAVLAVLPASTFHIAFAAGAMPLIFGAVIHFVPVLTRTASPGRAMRWLPLPVQLAGILTPLALADILPYPLLYPAAAAVSLAATIMIVWIMRRLRTTLGAPHPGARWYGVALLCLFFAVSLVPVWLAMPELRAALRLFHLHLNTLGFIGLAALGTLPVLLPTALGRAEPLAGQRLRQDLPFAAAGALLVAAGAAGMYWLAVAGAVLLLRVSVRNLLAWRQAYGKSMGLLEASSAPLVGATFGLAGLLLAGIAHGIGLLSPRLALIGFAAAFLLPLVTGALAHLLPVWLHPGRATSRRQRMHDLLVRGGEWRMLLFLVGGGALMLDSASGIWPLVFGLLWFLALLVAAFLLDRHNTADDNPAP